MPATKKLTIEEIKQIAFQRKWKLVSDIYINARSHLVWECSFGHIWSASLLSVKYQNNGCPHCSGKIKKDLSYCKDLAYKNGGKCLSTEYINRKTKMLWECEKGHIFKSASGKVYSGTWCPSCAIKRNNDSKRSSISEMEKIAKERGGKCISTSYINTANPIEWECALGHTWKARPGNIKTGTWCPECSCYRSERICRAYFETIFDEKFPRSYPKWLKTKDGNKLELDGYCEKLGIAFEHQGEQHYTIGRQFSKTRASLNKRIAYDRLKRSLCKLNGIVLIEIPALSVYLDIENLEKYIFDQLVKYEIVTSVLRPILINWKEVYSAEDTDKIEKLKEIALLKGGKLISTVYLGTKNKCVWECKNGHTWEAIPDSILNQKTWCAKCAGKATRTLEELQNIAAAKGGKLLSKKYKGVLHNYEWECQKGHTWKASGTNILHRRWCPLCGKEKSAKSRRKSVICVETGIVYESVTKAAKQLGLHHTSVSQSASGKRKTTGGFHFKYYNP